MSDFPVSSATFEANGPGAGGEAAFGLSETHPRNQAALVPLGHDLRAARADAIGGLRRIVPCAPDDAVPLQMERVRAASEVLARLMEEGLPVIEGNGGRRPAPPSNIRTAGFLRDVALRWSGRACEKGMDFHLPVAPDVPTVIRIDRTGPERETCELARIDVEMPRLSGIDVIRAQPGPTPRTPVIALTGHVLRANRAAIRAARADGIVARPVPDPAALGTAIATVRPHVTAAAPLPPPGGGAPERPSPAPTPDIDQTHFQRLLDLIDPDATHELVRRLKADLHAVERGLVHGFAGPDWDALGAQTHVLIALAGTVGAVRLQRAAGALNTLSHQRDLAALPPLRHDVLTLLDGLIHFISQGCNCANEVS